MDEIEERAKGLHMLLQRIPAFDFEAFVPIVAAEFWNIRFDAFEEAAKLAEEGVAEAQSQGEYAINLEQRKRIAERIRNAGQRS